MQARRVHGAAARDDLCPYPGLAAFDEDNAQWFYGRERLVTDLVKRLADRLDDGGLVIVAGSSGAGKSSLLRAGLISAINNGALPAVGASNWPRVVFNPTGRPLRAFANAIEPITGDDSPVGLYAQDYLSTIRQALLKRSDPAARVIVVVDQFEETFALCEDASEQAAFIDILATIATAHQSSHALALVTLGVRTDFYSHCTAFPQLRRALQDSQVVVGPMTDVELRQAIIYPADDVGLTIEPGLEDLLLNELGRGGQGDIRYETNAAAYEASRLPMLAYALRATWQRRHGHVLSVEAYRATGGIRHAIADTADAIYRRADATTRDQLRLFFLRLIVIGDIIHETRRLVPLDEFVAGMPDSAAADALLSEFSKARLLTISEDTVEITHEVLIEAWPQLRRWIDAERASHLTRQSIEDASTAWRRSSRDSSLLLSGSRLDAARAWLAEPGNDSQLTAIAGEFMDASQRSENRIRLVRRTAMFTVIVLAIVASITAFIALQLRIGEQRQSRLAIGRQLAVDAVARRSDNPRVSLLLDVQAMHMGVSQAAKTNITSELVQTHYLGSIPAPRSTIDAVTYAARGALLAVGAANGTVSLWRTEPRDQKRLAQIFVGRGAAITSLTVDPGTSDLGVSGADGLVTLWDISDPTSPRLLTTISSPSYVADIAFSSRGHLLAASTASGEVYLWNIEHPRRPKLATTWLDGHVGLTNVAFVHDGRVVAVARDDGAVILWDVSNPSRPIEAATLRPTFDSPATAMSLGADGRTLAVGDSVGLVSLWNVASFIKGSKERPFATIGAQTEAIKSVAFSPDDHVLATGSADGTVVLWNLHRIGRPSIVATLPIHYQADSVQFSPDRAHQVLAVGSDGGSITFWKAESIAEPYRIAGQPGPVDSMSFSGIGSGQLLATGTASGKVSIWNVAADPARPILLARYETPGPVNCLSFSGNGKILAAASGGSAVIWQLSKRGPRSRLYIKSLTASALCLAFDPMRSIIAVAYSNGTLDLWNYDRAMRLTLAATLVGNGKAVTNLAFLDNGRSIVAGTIASSSNTGSAVLEWSLTGIRLSRSPRIFAGPSTGSILALAASSNLPLIALSESNGLVRLDMLSNASRVESHINLTAASSMQFSPDDRFLAVVGSRGLVRLVGISRTHSIGTLTPVPDQISPAIAVAVSPDGSLLAAGLNSRGASVLLWEAADLARAVYEPVTTACAVAGGDLSRSEWSRYLPGLPYRRTCD